MCHAQFSDLPALLENCIARAERLLQIAVCWFTHRRLFEAVLGCLGRGVAVELLIEYDNQNVRPGGLDFTAFLRAGGRLYARQGPGLMHHKFALIDDAVLMTGSFNWTNNVNAENLLVTDDETALAAFAEEFARLRAAATEVFSIDPAAVKRFLPENIVENTAISRQELRRRIAAGARLWRIRVANAAHLNRVLTWPPRRRGAPKGGDVVLAADAGSRLTAIGIVEQLQPGPSLWSTAAWTVQVHWTTTAHAGPALRLLAAATTEPSRINGSALRVLEQLGLN